MEGGLSRPAFARTKHVLSEEETLDAFTNDRYHYNLSGFLHKRRGGGGASASSGSSSGSTGSTSSSSTGSKSPASKPVSGQSPGKPKTGPRIGGTSPSKPKSPIPGPPKTPEMPKLPKLPKPKSGSEPPAGSIPGIIPGHRPYHGSGGHLPTGDGYHTQDHGKVHSTDVCIDPSGFERLRCQKVDAIALTLLTIVFLFIAPFVICKCIKSCKQRIARRRNRPTHEEDGIELTARVMTIDPSPQTDSGEQSGNSNIGLAITTSEETVSLTDQQTKNTNPASLPAEHPSQIRQLQERTLSIGRNSSRVPPLRSSLNRGRSRFRRESLDSVASSLSSGMIRTAVFGEALQDATTINVPPLPANLRRISEPRSSSGDTDTSEDSDEGSRDITEEGVRESIQRDVESGDVQEKGRSQSTSSDRVSSSRNPDERSDKVVSSPDRSTSWHSMSSSDSSVSGSPGDVL